MATDLILFYTVGITDLQVLMTRADGTLMRGVIEKGEVRTFHQALLDGVLSYQIEEDWTLDDKKFPTVKCSVTVDPNQLSGFTLKSEEGDLNGWFQDGRVRLFPAKLAATHQTLKTSNGYRLVGAVGFSTYRDNRTDEPIALGKILADWFAACLVSGESETVNYLDGDMETPGKGRDAPFNRLAAQRIETAIRKAHDKHPDAIAWAMLVGGIPAAKDVVAAALGLHFPTVLQGQKMEGDSLRQVTAFSPSDALRARRIARAFVRRGRFVEAAAVACEYVADEFDCEWALPLQLTARLFVDNPLRDYHEKPLGGLPKGHLQASICNEETHEKSQKALPSDLVKLARHWELRALLPAIRAEAALAAGRYLEAINWSLTFFDAALLDGIGKTQGTLNDRRKTIDYHGKPPNPRLFDPPTNNDRRPCLEQNGRYYRYDTGGPRNSIWANVIQSPGLAALNTQLQTPDRHGKKPAGYRNLNTHLVLTTEELKDAIELFKSRDIWNIGTAIQPGQRFIGSKWVRPVFKDIGFDDAADVYGSLVRELMSKLENHKIR